MNQLVLCWGGPKHGEVFSLPLEQQTWTFPLLHKPSYKVHSEADIQRIPLQSTVKYDMERVFYFPRGSVEMGREFRVLLYPENRQGHMTRLIEVLDSLTGMCSLKWMVSNEDV